MVNKYLHICVITFICIYCNVDKKLDSIEYVKVDCNVNKYYIENLCEDEEEYLDWAENYTKYPTIDNLSEETLKSIDKETLDVDKSTSLFYNRLIKNPKTIEILSYIKNSTKNQNQSISKNKYKDVSVLMIPGMFYLDNQEVGADGKSIRSVANFMGIKDFIIPIKQADTVEKNATIICDYLNEMNFSDRIIIVSTSKGSTDFIRSVEKCGHEKYFSNIISWINIGGLNKGSYLVEAIDSHWKFRWEAKLYFYLNGYDYNSLLSLKKDNTPFSSDLLSKLKKWKTINIIGIPLFRHVTERARPFYEYLIHFGPNDGITMLPDSYLPEAYNIPAWRNDHYFRFGYSSMEIASIFNFILKSQKNP